MVEIPHKITLIFISLAGFFLIERLTESIFTSLDSIHPWLTNGIVIGIFIIAVVMGFLDHIQNSDKKKTHSQILARSFEIMSSGNFGNEYDKYEFCVPYPYEKYLDYERKSKYPTVEETLAMMNSPIDDWYQEQPKNFDFVKLTESNESDFIHAQEHLKSYKHITMLCSKAKKANTLWMESLTKEGIADPQKSELDRNASDTLQELQTSLGLLSQQLKDGAIVKGKCALGY